MELSTEISLGALAQNAGEHQKAAQLFRSALIGALERLARTLREAGKLDEEEGVCRALVATHANHFGGWRSLAQIARQRGRPDEALEHYRRAAAIAPNDVWCQIEAVNLLREMGRLDEAQAMCGAVSEVHPEHPAGWRCLAQIHRQRGARAQALDAFRKAVALDATNLPDQCEIANLLRELGRLDEAEPFSRALVETHPQLAAAWRCLAQIVRQRGQPDEALELYRRAATIAPGDVWLQIETVNLLREMGRLDEAQTMCGAVTEAHPGHPAGWRCLAQIHRQRGAKAQALDAFRKAVALDATNLPDQCEIANLLRDLGRLDEAEAYCRRLLEAHPSLVAAWRCLAQIAKQRGEWGEALERFEKARALDPSDPWGQVEIANLLRVMGRFEEAEAICRGLIETHPEHPAGWRCLAQIERQRGERNSALAAFRKACALEPGNLWDQIEIANLLRELERFDEAEREARAILDRNPNSALSLIAYIRCVRRRLPHREIVELFERAVEWEPEATEPKLALAAELISGWRLDEAEALYDSVLEANESLVAALMGKAQTLRRKGRRPDALALFQRAAELNEREEGPTVEYARELLDAGCARDAFALLQRAAAANSVWGHCRLMLGHVALAMGDEVAARQAFQAASLFAATRETAHVELANEAFRAGDLKAAIHWLEPILVERPTCVSALDSLAVFAQALDDMPGALSLRLKAMEIDPLRSNEWIAIGRMQATLGRLEEARTTFSDCREKLGDLPEVEIAWSAIQHDLGGLEEARRTLERAQAVFPTHFGLWFTLVFEHLRAGDFSWVERALNAPPSCSERESARVAFLWAQWALAQWDLGAAERHFRDALLQAHAEPWLVAWINQESTRCALLRADVESARSRLESSLQFNSQHRFKFGGARRSTQTHEGQLLDEYLLDAPALSRLRAALRANEPVDDLVDMVREWPDYTPAAIGLLTELRRKRLLDKADRAHPSVSLIPEKIGQFWDEDIPSDVAALCETWPAAHPQFAYVRFSTFSARLFLDQRGAHAARVAFDRAVEPAMKADIFRLAYLYHEGGYYIDADDRCLAPLARVDPGDCRMLLYQEPFGTIGNNFIGVTARHPAIEAALAQAIEAVERGDSDMVWLSTGPGLLTRAVAQYLAADIGENLKDVTILERHELARALAAHCMTSYKYTRKHWRRLAFHRRGVAEFSIKETLRSECASLAAIADFG